MPKSGEEHVFIHLKSFKDVTKISFVAAKICHCITEYMDFTACVGLNSIK